MLCYFDQNYDNIFTYLYVLPYLITLGIWRCDPYLLSFEKVFHYVQSNESDGRSARQMSSVANIEDRMQQQRIQGRAAVVKTNSQAVSSTQRSGVAATALATLSGGASSDTGGSGGSAAGGGGGSSGDAQVLQQLYAMMVAMDGVYEYLTEFHAGWRMGAVRWLVR